MATLPDGAPIDMARQLTQLAHDSEVGPYCIIAKIAGGEVRLADGPGFHRISSLKLPTTPWQGVDVRTQTMRITENALGITNERTLR